MTPSDASRPGRSGRGGLPAWSWFALALLLLAWLAFAFLGVPKLIRAGHAGTGPDLLLRVLSGRADTPVERYLEAWRRWALLASGAALLGLAGWAGVRRWLGAIGTLKDRTLDRAPMVSPATAVGLALGMGATAGVAEAAVALSRRAITGVLANSVNPDYLWMAPPGLAVLFAAGAGGLLLLARLLGSERLSLRLLVGVGSTLGTWITLRALEFGIHPWALAVLALGVAVQVTRLALDHPERTERLARWVAMPVVLVPLATFVVRHPVRDIRAARVVAALPSPPCSQRVADRA